MSIADALRPLVPVLAQSSAAVVEGRNLGTASRHADMLKSLALVWELMEKLEPELATTSSSEVEALREACRAAFETAATAKVNYLSYIQACILVQLSIARLRYQTFPHI